MREEIYSFTIGTFEGLAVADGRFNYPAQMFFANAGPELLETAADRYDLSARQVTTPYTCLHLDIGSEQILIDTGAGLVGSHADEIFPEVDHTTTTTGHLTDNLQAEGIEPSQVDTVILTHAHPDHIGGLLDEEGEFVFGKAEYYIGKIEWQFWFSDEANEKAPPGMVQIARTHLGALEDRINLITPDTEIRSGIQALAAPGHTPGHLVLSVASKGEHLLHMADLVLHPLFMEHPGWKTAFDIDPEQAHQTRRRILDEVAGQETLVFGSHFPPFPSIGHIVRGDEGWHWQPVDAAA